MSGWDDVPAEPSEEEKQPGGDRKEGGAHRRGDDPPFVGGEHAAIILTALGGWHRHADGGQQHACGMRAPMPRRHQQSIAHRTVGLSIRVYS